MMEVAADLRDDTPRGLQPCYVRPLTLSYHPFKNTVSGRIRAKIEQVTFDALKTREPLVKGERFVRLEMRAVLLPLPPSSAQPHFGENAWRGPPSPRGQGGRAMRSRSAGYAGAARAQRAHHQLEGVAPFCHPSGG